MFCQKCGNELNEGAAFCPKCGSKTGSENKSNHSQTNFYSEAVEKPGASDAALTGKVNKNNRIKNNKPLIIIAACILALIVMVKACSSCGASSQSSQTSQESIAVKGDDKTPYKWDISAADRADEAMARFCNDVDTVVAFDGEPWQIAYTLQHTTGDPVYYVVIRPGGGFKSPEETVDIIRKSYGFDELFLENALDVKYIFINNDNSFWVGFDEDGNRIEKIDSTDSDSLDYIINSVGW